MQWRGFVLMLARNVDHGQPRCRKYHSSEPQLKCGTQVLWREAKLALDWTWAVCTGNTNRRREKSGLILQLILCVVRQDEEGEFFFPKIWCILFRREQAAREQKCVWGKVLQLFEYFLSNIFYASCFLFFLPNPHCFCHTSLLSTSLSFLYFQIQIWLGYCFWLFYMLFHLWWCPYIIHQLEVTWLEETVYVF